MDLDIIKNFLRLAGIQNLSVRFDSHKEQIEATFTKANKKRIRLITFTDIEDLFTETPSQDAPGPPLDETPVKRS